MFFNNSYYSYLYVWSTFCHLTLEEPVEDSHEEKDSFCTGGGVLKLCGKPAWDSSCGLWWISQTGLQKPQDAEQQQEEEEGEAQAFHVNSKLKNA